jgi:hypothetical protein
LGSKDELVSVVIDGVLVGDLINDSYLRCKPAPTVSLADVYLWRIIWQAHRDVRRARRYFSRTRPLLYLTSYSTYIQHGIAVRVALLHGVRVISFGNYFEFGKVLSLKDWVHSKNPDSYAGGVATLTQRDEKLALAEVALSARMAGVIDSATSYMKRSAYALSNEAVPDVHGAAVIFLHDFYDSPHVYRDMVFPDFWEWICFTIETLQSAAQPFFIKPHPNQIRLSDGALGELRQRYPEVRMISSEITNKQLAEAGMACAITVYGTVAHEVAFLGVPTIACGHNPHISFDFCKTAKNRQEYADALRSCTSFRIESGKLRQQSLAFYYMHNLNMGEDDKALMSVCAEYRAACASGKTAGQALIAYLGRFGELRGFRSSLARFL